MIGLAVFVGLLVIFHRPILLTIGRRVVLHYAANENLKADFRLEGNPFGSITVRNLHAFAVGPSRIESIDIDYLYLDYSLFGFARHGLSRLLNNVEARSASIVLNPSKAPLRPRPLHPQLKLPRFFPDRLRATDLTFIVRNQPYDFVVGHADLDLNPRSPGELRIETPSMSATGPRVTVTDSAALDLTTALTLEAWVNPAVAQTGGRSILFKELATGPSYSLYANTADTGAPGTISYVSADTEASAVSPLTVGTWSHLAATYDGSTLRIFVNGVEALSEGRLTGRLGGRVLRSGG